MDKRRIRQHVDAAFMFVTAALINENPGEVKKCLEDAATELTAATEYVNDQD